MPRVEQQSGRESPLAPGENLLLNRGASKEDLARLREKYRGNERALQRIDVYDGSSPYHQMFTKLRNLYFQGKYDEAEEIIKWLKEHYPYVPQPQIPK